MIANCSKTECLHFQGVPKIGLTDDVRLENIKFPNDWRDIIRSDLKSKSHITDFTRLKQLTCFQKACFAWIFGTFLEQIIRNIELLKEYRVIPVCHKT